MGMNKVSEGSNMFSWISHTWNSCSGECSHACSYCYVESVVGGKQVLKDKYSGAPRLCESEMETNLGEGNTIFVQNMGDLFAADVPDDVIRKTLEHCKKYPDNEYLFQTKNPARLLAFFDELPVHRILSTTIETNRDTSEFSKAPSTKDRYRVMCALDVLAQLEKTERKFTCTLEPVFDFDIAELSKWIATMNVSFISIGADSKNKGLPEPPEWKIAVLVYLLKNNIKIKLKSNIKCLISPELYAHLLTFDNVEE